MRSSDGSVVDHLELEFLVHSRLWPINGHNMDSHVRDCTWCLETARTVNRTSQASWVDIRHSTFGIARGPLTNARMPGALAGPKT